MNQPLFQMTPSVREAIAQNTPVVALESTIITHGMPFPANVEMAQKVEAIIHEEGATPATIAVLDGVLHIGLEERDMQRLAQAQSPMKLSRADLAFAMSQNKTGGTTVAATMMAAHTAGIEIFATGGIGGVHRGAELSFDISADLQEFALSPVIVVSAGVKAILDIPKTLETLETLGVPVIGYGTDAFPAFWSQKSGLTAPLTVKDSAETAQFWSVRKQMQMGGGMLVANPIPKAAEIPNDIINQHIETALEMAETRGVTGKDVTPFLLQTLLDLTAGESLKANIALVENNARVAAQIACALKN